MSLKEAWWLGWFLLEAPGKYVFLPSSSFKLPVCLGFLAHSCITPISAFFFT